MSLTKTVGRPGGMTRRQRTRLIRGVQYSVFVAVGLPLVLKADWPRLSPDYFNVTLARALFPALLPVATHNPALYTALGSVS